MMDGEHGDSPGHGAGRCNLVAAGDEVGDWAVGLRPTLAWLVRLANFTRTILTF
jgi:hypothetical protein